MATWAELLDETYKLTKRPDAVILTEQHLRRAVRTAHKSGKYWRDLQVVQLTGLPLTEVQEVTLATVAPRLRAVASLTSAVNPRLVYDPVAIDDLLDHDGYLRTNVYWGLGTVLQVRAVAPEAELTLRYYQYPIVSPEASFNSWIAEEHSDVLVNLAAAAVLAAVGEQETARRIDGLAALLLADLQQDNLEIVGR